MKTKSLLLTALMALSSFLAVANDDPNNTGLFVISGKSGVYKLIYEGEKPSAMVLTILNSKGKVVYSESVRSLKGFIRPVNFKGMVADTYTIQLKQGDKILSASVDYAPEKKSNKVASREIDARKFAVLVSNEGEETFEVRIFDENQNLVKSYQETVSGSFGRIFNLSHVNSKKFTFEVYNSTGLIDTLTF